VRKCGCSGKEIEIKMIMKTGIKRRRRRALKDGLKCCRAQNGFNGDWAEPVSYRFGFD